MQSENVLLPDLLIPAHSNSSDTLYDTDVSRSEQQKSIMKSYKNNNPPRTKKTLNKQK
jgi:hypothetical protein